MNSRESFSTLLELRRAFQMEDPEEVAYPFAKLVLNMYGYTFEESTEEKPVTLLTMAQSFIYGALLAIEECAENYTEQEETK